MFFRKKTNKIPQKIEMLFEKIKKSQNNLRENEPKKKPSESILWYLGTLTRRILFVPRAPLDTRGTSQAVKVAFMKMLCFY